MGKIHILTKNQISILDVVKKEPFLKDFYFTGGTALSAFYLHHRYSEDLDLFTKEEIDTEAILGLVEKWSKQYSFTFTSEFREVVYVFLLTFPDREILKVDFAHYPYKKLEKENIIDTLPIDSLKDIATNKLFTISQRSTIKDFVDLYFLLEKFTIWDLMYGVQEKFRQKLDSFIVSSDLLKVEDFETLPQMIKPLTLEELKAFFREKAKELGKQATE